MNWESWLTAGLIGLMLVVLAKDWLRPEMALLSVLAALLVTGILNPEQAFSGYSNPAVAAVGALFVVAAGVQQTGALAFFERLVFRGGKSVGVTLARLMTLSSMLSAFMNNTPIVSMMVPQVQQWSERTRIPASKLLIPLSYATILGGMITVIGTSTNLVVSGLLGASGHEGLSFFNLAWVGIPATILVCLYFVLLGHRFLPLRGQGGRVVDEGLKQCLFEVKISEASPVVGKNVEEAGLRALEQAYLIHILRGDHVIPSSPGEVLQPGDVLAFSGDVTMMDQLLQRKGLERVLEVESIGKAPKLPLYEAVVASTSSLVGKTLKKSNFRDRFHAVVLAIQRNDEQLTGALGRVPIEAGDLLVVEAGEDFADQFNANRDEFYLVAPRRRQPPAYNPSKAPLAISILTLIVVLGATGVLPVPTAAFAGAMLMIATRCLSLMGAREALNLQVLVMIGAALGIGQAVESTGLAAGISHVLVDWGGVWGPLGVLIAIYLATNILTEIITNNAAAVIMLPIAMASARDLGLNVEGFAVAVAIAASASFITPIGYQTNLMVMSAGGYRFSDYVRAGLPVSIIVMVVTVGMIDWVWLER